MQPSVGIVLLNDDTESLAPHGLAIEQDMVPIGSQASAENETGQNL